VAGLNEALLAKAAETKLLRTGRVRADTTVVPANVAYPTDSGLLGKAIRRIAVTGQRIQEAGGAVRTRVRDRSRAAGKRAHAIAAKLRSRSQLGRDQVKDGVLVKTGELADLAQATVGDAHRLLGNAQRALRRAQAKAAELAEVGVRDAAAGRRRGRLARAVNDLSTLLEATTRIVGQTRQRIAGPTRKAGRVRLQGPGRRQRRRCRPRSPRRDREPRGRTATGPRSGTDQETHRPSTGDRDRRPRLRRGRRRG
jgi:IS5 family transposase